MRVGGAVLFWGIKIMEVDRKNYLRNFVHHDILGENRYKNIPRGADMTKQIHLRLEDNQYKEVAEYAKMNGMTVQDSISTALYIMLSKQKKKKYKANFTFIDLFAGIGGMRLAFEEAAVNVCIRMSGTNLASRLIWLISVICQMAI